MSLTRSQMDAELQKLYGQIPAIPDCDERAAGHPAARSACLTGRTSGSGRRDTGSPRTGRRWRWWSATGARR